MNKTVQMNTLRIGAVQVGIIVITIFTAIVHLTRNFPDPMFILNGLGYFTLLAGLLAPLPFLTKSRSMTRWAFIAFTAVTILAWLAIGERILIGYIDKSLEVILIALLFIDGRSK